jgi:protein-tyrosine phosphatase
VVTETHEAGDGRDSSFALAAYERRVLRWDGCWNVRDLGGLPCEDGGETAFGVVIRADARWRLTESGWRTLAALGVEVAIDLRHEAERSDDAPGAEAIPTVVLPMPASEAPPARDWPSMAEAYAALLDRFRGEVERAARIVAEAHGPVVIYCGIGRDRTGLVVAVLLRLAGVSPVVVAADHGLSDEILASGHAEFVAAAQDEQERAWRRRLTTPAGRTMITVLDELEQRYGSVTGYLGDAVLAARVRERLRSADAPLP